MSSRMRRTAAEWAVSGVDPFSEAAVSEVFDDATTGAIYDKHGQRSDFTDITLARSVIAYFQGIARVQPLLRIPAPPL